MDNKCRVNVTVSKKSKYVLSTARLRGVLMVQHCGAMCKKSRRLLTFLLQRIALQLHSETGPAAYITYVALHVHYLGYFEVVQRRFISCRGDMEGHSDSVGVASPPRLLVEDVPLKEAFPDSPFSWRCVVARHIMNAA